MALSLWQQFLLNRVCALYNISFTEYSIYKKMLHILKIEKTNRLH